MIESVTLLGSSSGRNAGDAALISGIMDSIDAAVGTRLLYDIPTIKPEFIWRSYQNRVRPISMLPWALSVKMLGVPTALSILRTDLSLVFDAVLFDRQLYNPLFNYLSSLWLMLPLAKQRGKKLGCFNVGAGPVQTPQGRRMLKDVCELMDFITVRDEDSFCLLREIGVLNPRILVTADAALNVVPSDSKKVETILNSVGIVPNQEILAINISAYLDTWAQENRRGTRVHGPSTSGSIGREKFIKIFSAALNHVSREIGAQILFVCTQHHDVPLTQELMRGVSVPVPKALISNQTCSHYDIKGVLAHVSLLLGMRLHATILCASAFTPTIALPHQPKVKHFFRSLGLEEYILDFTDFSEATLTSHLLRGWTDRAGIKATLLDRIPFLQEKAHGASELVLALHRGEEIQGTIDRLQTRFEPKAAELKAVLQHVVGG